MQKKETQIKHFKLEPCTNEDTMYLETKLNEVEQYCKSYLHGPQMTAFVSCTMCKNKCLGFVEVLQFIICSQP